MKANFEKENIVISIYDIIEELPLEAKREIGQSLIWDKEVFNDVLDAIINERIVTKSFGYNIFNARRDILESLNILERNHFRSLLNELANETSERRRWENDYWKLYHSIPDGVRDCIPQREPYEHKSINCNDDDIDNAINEYSHWEDK